MLNTELATEIVEAIEANPQLHDQSHWRKNAICGTTMCIAGWACFLNGDKFEDVDPEGRADFIVDQEGSLWEIDDRAASLLGIEDRHEVEKLFYEFNNETALSRLKLLAKGDSSWWTLDAE